MIATDMALHQDYTTKLKTFDQTSSGDKEGKTNDEEEEERVLIYAALIKCADISNIVSDNDEWSRRAGLIGDLIRHVHLRWQKYGRIDWWKSCNVKVNWKQSWGFRLA